MDGSGWVCAYAIAIDALGIAADTCGCTGRTWTDSMDFPSAPGSSRATLRVPERPCEFPSAPGSSRAPLGVPERPWEFPSAPGNSRAPLGVPERPQPLLSDPVDGYTVQTFPGDPVGGYDQLYVLGNTVSILLRYNRFLSVCQLHPTVTFGYTVSFASKISDEVRNQSSFRNIIIRVLRP